jgi:hypothetical protein
LVPVDRGGPKVPLSEVDPPDPKTSQKEPAASMQRQNKNLFPKACPCIPQKRQTWQLR